MFYKVLEAGKQNSAWLKTKPQNDNFRKDMSCYVHKSGIIALFF